MSRFTSSLGATGLVLGIVILFFLIAALLTVLLGVDILSVFVPSSTGA